MTGRLLTGRQVAEQLAVSVKTVLRWAQTGELPSIRLSNRAIRFPEDELDQWLQERAAPRGESVNRPQVTPPDASLSTVNRP